jgi:hypothetical protein
MIFGGFVLCLREFMRPQNVTYNNLYRLPKEIFVYEPVLLTYFATNDNKIITTATNSAIQRLSTGILNSNALLHAGQ